MISLAKKFYNWNPYKIDAHLKIEEIKSDLQISLAAIFSVEVNNQESGKSEFKNKEGSSSPKFRKKLLIVVNSYIMVPKKETNEF